tara:strand:+ start:3393 stop:4337 length:945 start_codon:yes stop_codon:yes gene_type:complete
MEKKKSNLLVLGSGGFLGKNTHKILDLENNYNLFQVIGKSTLDISNKDELTAYLIEKKIEFIINCAAFVGGISFGYKYQADLLNRNSEMALSIYQSSLQSGTKLIINPISNCAYPSVFTKYEEKYFWDGTPHESVFYYGFAKKLMVSLGRAYYEQHGLSSANIVMSNMYGPFDHFDDSRSHALGALIRKIHNAKINNLNSVEIWGSGKPVREWLYVEDASRALINSTSLKDGHHFFNVGVNRGISIIDLAKLIAETLEWKGEFKLNTSKPDGVMEKTVVDSQSTNLINWQPDVELREGIKKTINWYEKEGLNDF